MQGLDDKNDRVMSTIKGTIEIYFDTDGQVSQEQFKRFKIKLNYRIGEWIDDLAFECGFESLDMHSAYVDNIELL
jgi:hypothetical protein